MKCSRQGGNWLPAMTVVLALLCTGLQAQTQPVNYSSSVLPVGNELSFLVLGDMEPKPLAEFPHTEKAVEWVNRFSQRESVDFVIGVGDIPHKATMLQYEQVTPVLQKLQRPFFPIMGNEEFNVPDAESRFLRFANQWSKHSQPLSHTKYALEFPQVVLLMVSPDHGRDFNDDGIEWMLTALSHYQDKPVLLVVHGAQQGAYPERADKGVSHPRFAEVLTAPNLRAVISGDLHMDMKRVVHSKQIGEVHYLHIPALERTKIPDGNQHRAMVRHVTIAENNDVLVTTYDVETAEEQTDMRYRFSLLLSSQ